MACSRCIRRLSVAPTRGRTRIFEMTQQTIERLARTCRANKGQLGFAAQLSLKSYWIHTRTQLKPRFGNQLLDTLNALLSRPLGLVVAPARCRTTLHELVDCRVVRAEATFCATQIQCGFAVLLEPPARIFHFWRRLKPRRTNFVEHDGGTSSRVARQTLGHHNTTHPSFHTCYENARR